jgi:hypothetical protein
MAQDEDARVTLEVEEPIPMEAGITLKPGAYVGKRKRGWLGVEFWVELTAGEIKTLGGVPPSTDKKEYNVSQHVRQGKIAVF